MGKPCCSCGKRLSLCEGREEEDDEEDEEEEGEEEGEEEEGSTFIWLSTRGSASSLARINPGPC